MQWARQVGADAELRLYVRPGARVSAVLGQHGQRLKIAVAAPPVDGKANDALLALLAGLLGLPRRRLRLSAGESGRDKTVRIDDAAAADVMQRLAPRK